jgi:hypothetical protein
VDNLISTTESQPVNRGEAATVFKNAEQRRKRKFAFSTDDEIDAAVLVRVCVNRQTCVVATHNDVSVWL